MSFNRAIFITEQANAHHDVTSLYQKNNR